MFDAVSPLPSRQATLDRAYPSGCRSVQEVLWRCFELAATFSLVVFLLPLLATLALLVRAGDGGPALFRHRRIGKDGVQFECLKFRSMAVDAESRLTALLEADPSARDVWARERKLKADPRVTQIGSFLRKTSLDELPQLLNVIRGDMSLVGPRPIVADEIRHYGRQYRHYRSVKPGITGLWQVSGRSDVSYHRRVILDVTYLQHRSFCLNIKILLSTPLAVLLTKGSY